MGKGRRWPEERGREGLKKIGNFNVQLSTIK